MNKISIATAIRLTSENKNPSHYLRGLIVIQQEGEGATEDVGSQVRELRTSYPSSLELEMTNLAELRYLYSEVPKPQSQGTVPPDGEAENLRKRKEKKRKKLNRF